MNSDIKLSHHTFRPWLWRDGKPIVASEAAWRKPVKRNREAGSTRPRILMGEDVFDDWREAVDGGAMACPVSGESLSVNQRGHVWPMGWPSLSDGDDWDARPYTMQDVRRRLFGLIDATPNLGWMLTTKHPENVPKFTFDSWCKKVPGHVQQNEGDGRRWKFPQNLWLGVSCENQQIADERIPHLLRVPAAVRYADAVLTGPVDFHNLRTKDDKWVNCLDGLEEDPGRSRLANPSIHGVIVGGETGPDARPCNVEWIRDIVRQCKASGVPVFVTQLGSICIDNAVGVYSGLQNGWPAATSTVACTEGVKIRLLDPNGADPSEWPADLRVRELPGVRG